MGSRANARERGTGPALADLVPAKHFTQLMNLFAPCAAVGRAAKQSPCSLPRDRVLPVLSGFGFQI